MSNNSFNVQGLMSNASLKTVNLASAQGLSSAGSVIGTMNRVVSGIELYSRLKALNDLLEAKNLLPSFKESLEKTSEGSEEVMLELLEFKFERPSLDPNARPTLAALSMRSWAGANNSSPQYSQESWHYSAEQPTLPLVHQELERLIVLCSVQLDEAFLNRGMMRDSPWDSYYRGSSTRYAMLTVGLLRKPFTDTFDATKQLPGFLT